MWFSIYRTDWQHASASRAPLANCPFWLQLARRPSGSDIEPGTFGTKVEAADPREAADRWQLAQTRRYRTRVRLSALAGAWTDCQAVQPQNDQRLFRCRHLDRGQSRSTTLKDCGRAGMRAHQRPRRRRAPGFGVSPRSVAALTSRCSVSPASHRTNKLGRSVICG